MSIASDLTTLCTDQTNLVNDIIAQSVLVDIPAANMATLGSFSSDGTTKIVQLGAGGNATLSVPVQDGQKFRVSLAGHGHSATATVTVALCFNGSQTNFLIGKSPNGTSPNQPFLMFVECVWDSTTNKLLMAGVAAVTSAVSGNSVSLLVDSPSISSPSTLDFTVNGHISETDSGATMTITEFRAYAA